jgi:hypothetical protein
VTIYLPPHRDRESERINGKSREKLVKEDDE